jgi:hypothetical protein
VLCVSLVAGLGWLYVLRGLGWLPVGPRLADALPLLQLAGNDGQPLARVAAAWMPVGIVAGLAMRSAPRVCRAALGGLLGSALLFIGSEASFAVARNLSLNQAIASRRPGLGAWVEALLFGVGCAIPGAAATLTSRFRRLDLGSGSAELHQHDEATLEA